MKISLGEKWNNSGPPFPLENLGLGAAFQITLAAAAPGGLEVYLFEASVGQICKGHAVDRLCRARQNGSHFSDKWKKNTI